MSSMAFLTLGSASLYSPSPPPKPRFSLLPHLRLSSFSSAHLNVFSHNNSLVLPSHFFKSSTLRIISFKHEDAGKVDAAKPVDTADEEHKSADQVFGTPTNETTGACGSFAAKLALALGIAAMITALSVGLMRSSTGSSLGIQCVAKSSSSSVLAAAPKVGFTFKAFGYVFVLPEHTPGWVYFWLLMAAGCGLFISEEALNIWVGISLARMLCLDGKWLSFTQSFSINAPYILSTVLWIYWGVCISDLIPFYLGKLFRQAGASDDVCKKLGIGKEKAVSITRIVQRYGNFTGFIERFSFGVRNPTAFLAGALGVSPECFFAGVCCGGFITVPVQLGIGFLLRDRPLIAVATVATVVGIWTVFPYAVAASTALFLFLRCSQSP